MTEKISLYIIEDYFLNRITYVKHFENHQDFEVIGAYGTAEECLSAMSHQQASVVLVDLGLPQMNGIEATKRIQELYPDTKCIILTSHETEEEIMACIACGARGYVLKDTTLNTLEDVIKAVKLGAYYFDEKIEHIPLATIPTPNSTDFNNLYEKHNINQPLTDREKEVLNLMVQGKSNPEIAKELFISANTAKAHVCNIISKLDVKDRVQAAVKALQMKIV